MKNDQDSYIYWNYNSGHYKREIKALNIIPNTDIVVTLGKNEKQLRLHQIFQRDNPLITTFEAGNGIDEISCLDTNMFKGIIGYKDTISYLDFTRGEKISEFNNKTPLNNSNLEGCKFMNDKLIAVWSKDKTVSLYDIRKDNSGPRSRIFDFTGENKFTCAGFNGNYMSFGNKVGRIVSLDLRNSYIHNDRVSKYCINSIDLYSDHTILVSDSNGGIRMYNLETKNILLHHEIHDEFSDGTKNGYGSDDYYDDDDDDDDDDSNNHKGSDIKYNTYYIADSNKLINGTDWGEIQISSIIPSPTRRLPYKVNVEKPLVTAFESSDLEAQKINIVKYDKLKQRSVACSMDGQLHIWDNLIL